MLVVEGPEAVLDGLSEVRVHVIRGTLEGAFTPLPEVRQFVFFLGILTLVLRILLLGFFVIIVLPAKHGPGFRLGGHARPAHRMLGQARGTLWDLDPTTGLLLLLAEVGQPCLGAGRVLDGRADRGDRALRADVGLITLGHEALR